MIDTRSNQQAHGLNVSVKTLQVTVKPSTALEARSYSEQSQRQNWTAKSSASSNSLDRAKLSQSQQGGPKKWLTKTIQDKKLRSTTLSRIVDGVLDRFDVISIFRAAKDSNQIDKTELTDLRKLANYGKHLGMPEHVQVLSKKVAFGNYANRNYQGKSLGNLWADSTGSHLEKLVKKWFMGSDRPTAASSGFFVDYSYQKSNAALFKDGISYSDIAQGDVGDCYFLAGLAATALQSPEQIQNMFTDNGDGTFTVRFYKDNGVADYVTVDRFLPVDLFGSGKAAYAGYSNELWVALAEKAYAQWNESGDTTTHGADFDHTNSYLGIEGGVPALATWHITGRQVDGSFMADATPDVVVNSLQAGQLVTFGSAENPASADVLGGHAYTLVGYDTVTQKFTLYNPWGFDASVIPDSNPDDGKIELTWTELNSNFDYWNFTV